jgi:hypothetical protein
MHGCVCGREFSFYSDLLQHRPHCPGETVPSDSNFDHPSGSVSRLSSNEYFEPESMRICVCGWHLSTHSDELRHRPHCPGEILPSDGQFDHPPSGSVHTLSSEEDSDAQSDRSVDITPSYVDSEAHHVYTSQSGETTNESNNVSFGNNNTGAQFGINNGLINYNNPSTNPVNTYYQSSEGRQILNANITAGRDIYIGTTNLQ